VLGEPVVADANPPAEILRQVGKSPLKVFIPAGQSNMQGQGTLEAKDDTGKENGDTYFLIGDAFGKAMIPLVVPAKPTLTIVSPLDYQVIQREHEAQRR